jgi:hypothetical protein
MSTRKRASFTRRGLLRSTSTAASIGPLLVPAAGSSQASEKPHPTLNRSPAPSDLKITDMRACTVAANCDYPIIRIDTNQGVYGLGEVFAAGVKGSALIL